MKIHGERDGTRALIEVMLLGRHMTYEHVVAGLAAALQAGAMTADAVALTEAPGSSRLVLAANVVHLDPALAVFEAMKEGWARQTAPCGSRSRRTSGGSRHGKRTRRCTQ
jgi:hypothetical protein